MVHFNGVQSLVGKILEYTYTSGDKVMLTIKQTCLSFEWYGGQLDGTRIEGLSYQYKQIRKAQFLVNWHNKNANSFVTLLIDLEEEKVYGSALVEYLNHEPFEIFDEADITNVSAIE